MAHPPAPRICVVPAAVVTALLAVGCGGDGDGDGDTSAHEVPMCTEVDLALESCALAFQPTFDNVFTQVLQPTCGPVGGACHGQDNAIGARGGLVFTEIDAAHDNLLSGGLVVPGDPSCSEMVVRLESADPLVRMPPGNTSLDNNVRCSIEHWINNGALR